MYTIQQHQIGKCVPYRHFKVKLQNTSVPESRLARAAIVNSNDKWTVMTTPRTVVDMKWPNAEMVDSVTLNEQDEDRNPPVGRA
jgi:hypothetical protein